MKNNSFLGKNKNTLRQTPQGIFIYKGLILQISFSKSLLCIDFLYQTGLGSKNSQGFGMFNII
ncbi:CRISPR-associated endoribonuclease Cas6 [Eshraghiella crossota]|uniref:CRISPR-associated endoribonuclease Cas6 n=1 Tax=Eshraghiella crossota TaxID=45851 RepID=UPI0009D75D93